MREIRMLRSTSFLAYRNLADVLLGNAYIAIAAIGMSMVIISGNIDISVGALIGVLATVSGSLAVEGAPIFVSWLVPLDQRRKPLRQDRPHKP